LIGLLLDNYRKSGGNIRFGTKAEKIVVDNGKARGVILENNEELPADIVVSAADSHTTIYHFLQGGFLSEQIETIFRIYKPFPSYVQVSMGVDADLKGEPGFIGFVPEEPVMIDPKTRANFIAFRIFNFDPTFAPPGKTAVVGFFPTYNYEHWDLLRKADKAKYDLEKAHLAALVAEIFQRRFPAAREKIETVDVATPATVIRYTGNWKGSMEGWLMTPATGFRQLPLTLPNLSDFYMVGQWLSPGGGLPSGLLTARKAAQMICRDNRRKFKVDSRKWAVGS
jgi:phytoene dehydrogenase-like protein